MHAARLLCNDRLTGGGNPLPFPAGSLPCCRRTSPRFSLFLQLTSRWFAPRLRVAFQAPQFRAHLRCALVAQVTVLFKGTIDDVFQFCGQVGIQPHEANWLPFENGAEDDTGTFATEG